MHYNMVLAFCPQAVYNRGPRLHRLSRFSFQSLCWLLPCLPCAAHDLWAVEGEGVGLIGLGAHDVGFRQQRVCEEVVGLKVEF